MKVSQLEFELKEQVWQKDMYRVLGEQKYEALEDLPVLQAELEKAQREALSVKWEHAELVEKLRAEMNELKTLAETLRSRMDLLASENEATKEELALVKDQLRVAKDKADKWDWVNDEVRAQLDSAVSEWDNLVREYTALKSKLEAASINSSEVEEMSAQYKTDVEIAEARLITKAEYVKGLSRRETLEEIHAGGFDLSAEIEEVKRLEIEAKRLYEPKGSSVESGFGED
ncbi:interactor of constitutive active ROPs 2, chloroplastic-like [Nicotiana tomentosiformis]|uniref:interactor of constitutive active ROPs 2, chloroplastic-like n=1 Tax=Nicotiana tomentosiformis TaxID=4098 RepID=UPI00388CE780